MADVGPRDEQLSPNHEEDAVRSDKVLERTASSWFARCHRRGEFEEKGCAGCTIGSGGMLTGLVSKAPMDLE